jgi:hypothetical protein
MDPGGDPMSPLDAVGAINRPVHAVTALFADRARADAAVTSLLVAGYSPFPVRPRHPGPCSLRDWGDDTTIMNLYLQGLAQGHVLLQVPANREDREDIGRLLSRHGGHAAYWFAPEAVESLSVLV